MKYRKLNRVPEVNRPVEPIVCSYDTGYEHSLERSVAVKRMVEKSEQGGGAAVSGIYRELGAADHAISALREAGFRNTDISVLFSKNEGTTELGGALCWLARTGALTIEGVGLLSAVGPIMSTPAGADAGGILGSIADALLSIGVPEYEAKRYEARVKDGGILLSVAADDADWISRARDILGRTRADDISVIEAESAGRRETDKRVASSHMQ
jgi:Heat induced stress protein YflT